MYIEYACYDYSLSDDEIKNNINSAIKMGAENIALFYSGSTTFIKSVLDDHPNVKISCPVDYPYGLLDSKSRLFVVSQLAKSGVNSIDLVVPAKFIANRKYDKLRDDIKNNLLVCQENNINLRYILEYRVFNHETLAKTCQILKGLGIEYVFPSTGHMIDDINDNIIAAKYLHTKSEIKVICNGNMWVPKHVDNLKNSGVYGVRAHYLSSLDFFIKNKKI
jgi:deoxyribose-phosphate aldolase